MKKFKYEAKDFLGGMTHGTFEAAKKEDVEAHLRRINLTPVKISRDWLGLEMSFGRAVKSKDMVAFTRMFAATAQAALPLDQSLHVLQAQATSKALKHALQRVQIEVESGSQLSEGMRNQPRVFDTLYTNMVQAGEISGSLDVLLSRLADLVEKTERIKGKVKGALIYPAILLTIATTVFGVLLIFVVPKFVEMFLSAGASLPLPTRVAYGAGVFLKTKWWMLLVGIAAFAVLVKFLATGDQVKRVRDRILLKMPVLGQVVRKGAIARFTRTLSTLLEGGLGLLPAMELCSATTSNIVLQEAINEAIKSIATGSDIAGPLERSGEFPPLVTQMVAIGETSGNLDQMLAKVADYYEEEVDRAAEAALKLIEPLMLVVMAVMVAGVMVAVYLPMFDLIGAVAGMEQNPTP